MRIKKIFTAINFKRENLQGLEAFNSKKSLKNLFLTINDSFYADGIIVTNRDEMNR